MTWCSGNGEYPLHQATRNRNLLTVRWWIAHGIPVDIRDAYESTPLIYASGGAAIEVITELLRLGAVSTLKATMDGAHFIGLHLSSIFSYVKHY